ncbi:hypothetical protein MHEL_50540 [Mycolicibacterium helvum]|uniref:Uncharacterized protein n=1 Tax=Mycolicibacterium helvum TaxID=1534349 RepID=A0A7I7TE04_9MYCO|nr:hypothetical protein MHEL_50540 [Mycolicibacterium helvum]
MQYSITTLRGPDAVARFAVRPGDGSWLGTKLSWNVAGTFSRSIGRHYGNDNSTETNEATVFSVNLAFLQLTGDNKTETGYSSSLQWVPITVAVGSCQWFVFIPRSLWCRDQAHV